MIYQAASRRRLPDGHIRVLEYIGTSSRNSKHLACKTKVVELQNRYALELSYSALSYVWGDRTVTTTITCDDVARTITKNLQNALSAIWKEQPSILMWVDALCIDQHSLAERNHQIFMMGDIFSSAETVFVYLGPALAGQNRFWTLLQDYSLTTQFKSEDGYAKVDHSFAAENKSLSAGIADLISRQWFCRAWTYQEIRLASNAVALCGDSFMPWSSFLGAIKAFNERGALIPRYAAAFTQNFRKLRAFLREQAFLFSVPSGSPSNGPMESSRSNIPKAPLMDLLLEAWPRFAGDSRDKVYSLMSSRLTSTPYMELVPDYSLDSRKTFIKVIRTHINNTNRLDFLQYAVGTCDRKMWPGRSSKGNPTGLVGEGDFCIRLPNLLRESISRPIRPRQVLHGFEHSLEVQSHHLSSNDDPQFLSNSSPESAKKCSSEGFPTWICDWQEHGAQNTSEAPCFHVDSVFNTGAPVTLMRQSVRDFSNRLVLRGYALARLSYSTSAVYHAEVVSGTIQTQKHPDLKPEFSTLLGFRTLPRCALHKIDNQDTTTSQSNSGSFLRIGDIRTAKKSSRGNLSILLLEAMLHDLDRNCCSGEEEEEGRAIYVRDPKESYRRGTKPVRAFCFHGTYPRSPMAELDWLFLLDGLNTPVLLRPFLRKSDESIASSRSEIGFHFVSALPLTVTNERDNWEQAPCVYGEVTLF